jgi:hypothetical protein
MNDIKFKYNCEYCNYHTDYISLWNKHIETEKHIYGKRKQRNDIKDEHKCSKCSFHSKNFTNYRQHYLNYHGTREERERGFKYYCNICDYGTFSDTFYEKHLETYRHQRLERFLFE